MKGIPSREAATVRDLLRHLGNADRLRHNPLVAELMRGVQNTPFSPATLLRRVRTAVVAALEAMAPPREDRSRGAEYERRLCTIVERCDLAGEVHASVASDLGICRRQLYLDRRKALVRLEEMIRAQLAIPITCVAIALLDPFEMQLDVASRLKCAGHLDSAYATLEDLAGQTLAPADRMLALHHMVDVLCETGEYAQARVVLERAKLELGILPGADVVAQAAVLAAEAIVALDTGGMPSARATCERGIALLYPALHSNSARVRSLLLELYLVDFDARYEAGSFEDMIRIVASAKALGDAGTDPALLAALHFHSARTHAMLPWGLGNALGENAEASEIARRHGLIRYEAVALANLSSFHLLRGENDEALRCGRHALLLSKGTATPNELATVHQILARANIATGNATHALELLSSVKSSTGTDLQTLFDVVESEALVAQGRFDAAAHLAHSSRLAFERGDTRKRISIALCAEARAYAGLGKHKAAVAAVGDAVDAAEAAPTAYSLITVYNASAEITNNKRHAEYAADLHAALCG